MSSTPKANSSVWFVIVTYRPHLSTLKRLLSALDRYPVVVADNTDQYQISNIKYQIDKSNIKYIKTKTNLGYGGGANVGIKLAIKNGAEWVVVLNQDLVANASAISLLVTKLNSLNPGIAGPIAGELESRRYTTIIPSRKADYVSGSCFAVHRKVLDKVGYFYEPYFLYYEEVDLCLRAPKSGFPIVHLPVAGITHEESVGLGKGSFAHQYYLARNHLLLVERRAPWLVKLRELLRLPKTIREHLIRGESGALLGIWHYIWRRFGKL